MGVHRHAGLLGQELRRAPRLVPLGQARRHALGGRLPQQRHRLRRLRRGPLPRLRGPVQDGAGRAQQEVGAVVRAALQDRQAAQGGPRRAAAEGRRQRAEAAGEGSVGYAGGEEGVLGGDQEERVVKHQHPGRA
jgi:hypothetical protein